MTAFQRFSAWMNNLIMTRMTPLDRPGGFLRWLFRGPVLMYRLGMGGWIGKRFLLLTTTGRRTGKLHVVALEYSYNPTDGTYQVMAGWGDKTDWARNTRANARVQVRVGKGRFEALAEPLSDGEVAQALLEINRINPGAHQIWERRAKQTLDGSLESLRRAAKHFPTFRLRPFETQPLESGTIDRSQRVLFDNVAEAYQAGRPAYPEALIEDVITLSGLPADGRILEVGCGPGNATLAFARRGYSLLGIELGDRLASLAVQACQPYPKVKIVTGAFEDYPLEEGSFDLVIAAEAFHWIPPKVGFPRAAAALKNGGSLALWWIVLNDPGTPLFQEIADHYRRHVPEKANPNTNFSTTWVAQRMTANFANSGCFSDPILRLYAWEETYTAERYIQYISTFSADTPLTEEARSALNNDIRQSIERAGGVIQRPLLAVLFLAKVKR
jgi:deazaflavin-dependent oxidoreductase (nitroreductase family)